MKMAHKPTKGVQIARVLIPMAIIAVLSGCAPLKETILKKFSPNKSMPEMVVAKSPQQIQQELKEKVSAFSEAFYVKYPALKGYANHYDVKFLPDSELSKLFNDSDNRGWAAGGDNTGIMSEGNGYSFLLPQSGEVSDYAIAKTIAFFAFQNASEGFDFVGNPFNTDLVPDMYSRLFANGIEKGEVTKGVLAEDALIAFFIDKLGSKEFLRCYLEKDDKPLSQVFDRTFGEGSYAKMIKYGISPDTPAADKFVEFVKEKRLVGQVVGIAREFGYDVSVLFR
jgi:hypothetical protein